MSIGKMAVQVVDPQKALVAVGNMFKRNSGTAATFGQRMGTANSSVKALVQAVKEDPIGAAMVAWELYGAVSEEFQVFREYFPGEAKIIDEMKQPVDDPDKVDSTPSPSDIVKFRDEFETIESAARAIGGYDKLISLRKAIMMSDDVHLLYVQTKNLSKVFR